MADPTTDHEDVRPDIGLCGGCGRPFRLTPALFIPDHADPFIGTLYAPCQGAEHRPIMRWNAEATIALTDAEWPNGWLAADVAGDNDGEREGQS